MKTYHMSFKIAATTLHAHYINLNFLHGHLCYSSRFCSGWFRKLRGDKPETLLWNKEQIMILCAVKWIKLEKATSVRKGDVKFAILICRSANKEKY